MKLSNSMRIVCFVKFCRIFRLKIQLEKMTNIVGNLQEISVSSLISLRQDCYHNTGQHTDTRNLNRLGQFVVLADLKMTIEGKQDETNKYNAGGSMGSG